MSVGYRVNSKRGIAFRKWANNVLKQYIIKGYAINERRLLALEKTVDIQSRMLADALDIEESDVLRAVNEYTEALLLLDQYNLEYAKPITIKDNCWLASNVVVCGGVTIGEGCVIGAGSVVTKDIPPYSLAVGNPCRVIRKITEKDHMPDGIEKN